jgi:ethanolaminephosphotransferase
LFLLKLLIIVRSDSDRLGILLDNTQQILDIVKMAFPKHSFNPETSVTDCTAGVQSSIEELECEWISILELLTGIDSHVSHDVLQKAIYRFLYRAQSLMSGAASTYKLSMLFSGSLAAAAACVFSLVVAFGPLRKSGFPGVFLVVTALLSGAIMFASSYVEEEQQYWYWIVTAWAAYLHIRLYDYLFLSC